MILQLIKYYFFVCAVSLAGLFSNQAVFAQQNDLNDYLELALENNPSLKSWQKKAEIAHKKVSQTAASFPDPELSAGYFAKPVETMNGPQEVKISVNQMFPAFGTLKNKSKEKYFKALALVDVYENNKNQLVRKLRMIWYDLYFVNKKIENTRQNIRLLKLLEKQSLTRYENGKTSMVSVLSFQISLREMQEKEKSFELEKQVLISEFKKITGTDFNETITIPDTLIFDTKLFNTFHPDTVFKYNLGLQSIEKQIMAADYGISFSELSGFPRVGIGIDYVFVGERENSNNSQNGEDIIMPMVKMSIPVFRKKYRLQTKQSKLLKQKLEFEKEDFKNQLMYLFEKIKADYQDADHKEKLYNELWNKANQALSVAKSAYEGGNGEYQEVLELQMKLYDYRIKRIGASVNKAKQIALIREIQDID